MLAGGYTEFSHYAVIADRLDLTTEGAKHRAPRTIHTRIDDCAINGEVKCVRCLWFAGMPTCDSLVRMRSFAEGTYGNGIMLLSLPNVAVAVAITMVDNQNMVMPVVASLLCGPCYASLCCTAKCFSDWPPPLSSSEPCPS